MLKTIIKIITALSFSAVCITTAAAQENDFSKLEGLPPFIKGDISCKAVCTFTPTAGEFYYVKVGSKYYVTPLIAEGLSQAIPVRGSRTFILYRKTENEEGKEIHTPVLTTTLGGSGKEYLIIISKLEGKPITSKVINISASSLPANNVHLFNYSPVALGIQVEKDNYVAQTNKYISHNFKAAGRNSYTSAKVLMRYQGENKIMGSKRLRLIPGRRVIFICFASAKRAKMGSTPLGMVTIQDMPK